MIKHYEQTIAYLKHISEVLFLGQDLLSHQLEEGELGRHGPAQHEPENRVVGEAHDVLHHPEVGPEKGCVELFQETT